MTGEFKYNYDDIVKELKEKNVWIQFVEWAYKNFDNLHSSQHAFEFCYETFKLNEPYFINEWTKDVETEKKSLRPIIKKGRL